MGNPDRIDPNTAELEVLSRLPGIGPALAKRIQAGRPYPSLESLLKVNGITENKLESWKDLLRFESPGSPENQEEAPELAGIEIPANEMPAGPFPEDFDEPDNEAETEQAPAEISSSPETHETEEKTAQKTEVEPPSGQMAPVFQAQPPAFSRTQVLVWMVISTFFAALLAVITTLGIVALINQGNLRFAQPVEIREVNAGLDSLETGLGILGEDLDGLRTRVDNLDTVTGRVTTVEETVAEMQAEVASLEQTYETLSGDLDMLQAQTEGLAESTSLHEEFLISLRDLLTQLFPPEVEK